jgi:hypothetical protein
MSAASSFLTLAEIAAPTGRRHPSPAGPQSGRDRSSSDRARAHDWVLSDWALGISRPLTVRYRRGEQDRSRGSRGTPESHHLVP